ncbi:Probable 1-acyl-sn-glycerol-3-phosphate acyltransferase 4 [Galdieria sulphuraria]|uniref:Acyltransferase n=1 Tax=Galdieria sulphuraria TaxID=130081 RepID=M2X266_GALSU|nr:acyltransferase [Galdieria sulphuraria]EME30465.1 acyltransferase [Galdieria sulphuraria]GJD06392.1 Probable 1-acyl-sn-glycerol-3-phosphate acyltransferase 4 [Galdieria sulphuraria]|eukprot:XP_005706985.1 acyltransferase [Galdieria sulphuraria]
MPTFITKFVARSSGLLFLLWMTFCVILVCDVLLPILLLICWLCRAKYITRRLQSFVLRIWMSHFIFYVERLAGVELVITGDKFVRGESAVVVCNHQSWTDSLILYSVARQVGRHGDVKFFAKKSLAYFPFYGIAAVLVRVCIFITRHMDRDRKIFRRIFSYLTDASGQWPFWLIIFCEGTRFNLNKREKSQEFAKKHDLPVLYNVLLPKTGGFSASVSSLRDNIGACYDITIGYPSLQGQVGPSISDILFRHQFGRQKWVVHVHQKRVPIQLIGDSEEEMKELLYRVYKEKDKQMENFKTNGNFDGTNIPFHKLSVMDLFFCFVCFFGLSLLVLVGLIWLFQLIRFSN